MVLTMATNFLEFLRQQNIYGGMPPPSTPIPQSIPGMQGDMFNGMSNGMDIPPPDFNRPGIYNQLPSQNPLNPVDFETTSPQFTSRINSGITPQGPSDFPGASPEPEMDASARMREIYNPSTDASNSFQNLINQYPQRNDPSWLRRIGSMVVDYTKGPAAGRALFEGDFRDKQEDWKNKIGPSQQAANLERYENTNQRTLAYNQIAMELREKAQNAKEKLDIRNADIRQQRADIYNFRANNPNMKIVMTKGGNVMAVNPLTGETHDTGIPTGSMTEINKMNLTQDNEMERIGARGDETRQTEGVKQGNRIFMAGVTGDQTRQTNAAKVEGAATKPLMPTQIRIQEFNRARQLINIDDELGQYIKIGNPGANDFTIDPPSNGFFNAGPTVEQYKKIKEFIYGNDSNTPVSSHSTPTTPTVSTPVTPTQTGSVKVRDRNGRTGIFRGTVAEAQAAGFTVIGQ